MGNQPDRNSGALFVLGITFIAIGAARHRGLLVVGLVFVAIGAARLRRSRR